MVGSRKCSDDWARISERIMIPYRRARSLSMKAALAGRPCLFRAKSRSAGGF